VIGGQEDVMGYRHGMAEGPDFVPAEIEIVLMAKVFTRRSSGKWCRKKFCDAAA